MLTYGRKKRERKRKEKRGKVADMWAPLPGVVNISKITFQNSQMVKYKWF